MLAVGLVESSICDFLVRCGKYTYEYTRILCTSAEYTIYHIIISHVVVIFILTAQSRICIRIGILYYTKNIPYRCIMKFLKKKKMFFFKTAMPDVFFINDMCRCRDNTYRDTDIFE